MKFSTRHSYGHILRAINSCCCTFPFVVFLSVLLPFNNPACAYPRIHISCAFLFLLECFLVAYFTHTCHLHFRLTSFWFVILCWNGFRDSPYLFLFAYLELFQDKYLMKYFENKLIIILELII